jgi:hypothetical protein
MGNCAKWENRALWKPGDDPVENPPGQPDGSPPHAPPFQENLVFLSDLVVGLESAVAELGARLDAQEFTIHQLFAFIEQPLPPEVLINRLKQLREEML